MLSEQQVAYGTSAIAPAEPKREGYVFDGWDREFDAVLADIVVTAKFRIAGVFTITWLNDDESIIDQTEVLEGETPTHADPSKPATAEFTYIFTGWSPNIESVTGDASYTATYEEIRNKYIISAEAVNGTVEGDSIYKNGVDGDLLSGLAGYSVSLANAMSGSDAVVVNVYTDGDGNVIYSVKYGKKGTVISIQ